MDATHQVTPTESGMPRIYMRRADKAGPAVTASRPVEGVPDVLTGYAEGLVAREDALSDLGLRDYAELLVVLGDHDLVPPRPPEHEIENQAVAFERLWRSV